jgi:hypothetical protein
MNHRYKVRVFSSDDGNGETAAGTIVQAIERSFYVQARSADDVEKAIQLDISKNKLAKGRVYQVCPQFGNPEPIRAFSVAVDGAVQRAFLDPAQGIYSEFRKIRYDDVRRESRPDLVPELQQAS